MSRLALLTVTVIALAVAASCNGAVIDGDAPVAVGAQDPALINRAATLVFSFSTAHTCKDLVDLAPDEIGTLLAPEGAPLQIHDKSEEEHVFGKVAPDAPTAFFVLASSKSDLNQRVEFDNFAGTVFGIGCRDFSPPSGTRHDLPLTLFPVGLR